MSGANELNCGGRNLAAAELSYPFNLSNAVKFTSRGERVAVDDEEDALGLLRVVLETAGAQVATASSALAALQLLESLNPDVLVADIGMPDIDGFELIRRIRTLPNREISNVPAAALTAFARSEDRTKALQSGYEMHLAKPVDPGELVASVATLVRRRRMSSHPAI